MFGFADLRIFDISCFAVSADIAPLRAYRRAVTNPQKTRPPFAPIQYENARGFTLLFASGEGEGKSGGEEGEGGNGIGGFIEASGCGVSCCAVPVDIAPLRAYMRAVINPQKTRRAVRTYSIRERARVCFIVCELQGRLQERW
ncbi:MAG: hypothetical protein ACT6FF_03975 [Methanosarcinaceae archaeon]